MRLLSIMERFLTTTLRNARLRGIQQAVKKFWPWPNSASIVRPAALQVLRNLKVCLKTLISSIIALAKLNT